MSSYNLLTTLASTIVVLAIIIPLNIAFAVAENSSIDQQQQQQPNIKAANVYQTHSIILGKNVKNLVVLIPDEAHESMNQVKSQLPLINQPYVPQNSIVSVGTTITWFMQM